MISITIKPSPTTRWLSIVALRIKLALLQRRAAYYERRARHAHAGVIYARNNGLLPACDGYYHEIINESAAEIKSAHEQMVVAKSDLLGLER